MYAVIIQFIMVETLWIPGYANRKSSMGAGIFFQVKRMCSNVKWKIKKNQTSRYFHFYLKKMKASKIVLMSEGAIVYILT